MTVSFSELRAREVVRLCDAKTLGCVTDLTLDACTGRICALCVSPPCSVREMWQGNIIVVPWDAVKCIGDACILVDLRPEDCCVCQKPSRKKRGGEGGR